MREKLANHAKHSIYDGITPACAGKTTCLSVRHPLAWDHPRVCGKNAIADEIIKNFLGSPPRVREKLTFE